MNDKEITAEVFVTLLKDDDFMPCIELAKQLGWTPDNDDSDELNMLLVIQTIADAITLPEDKPAQRTWDRGTGYDHEPTVQRVTKYEVVADYQDDDNGR